jgi:hypothetical protein
MNSNPVLVLSSSSQCPTKTQYPEATLGNVDSNFSNSRAVGFMGHDPSRFTLWAAVEPARHSPPIFEWDVLDSELSAAKAQGFQMILTIDDTPNWAIDPINPGPGKCGGLSHTCKGTPVTGCTFAPASYIGSTSDWGLFIQGLMDHLSSAGYLGTVRAIELWNEANLPVFWGHADKTQDPSLGLSILVEMAKTAYNIIHNYSACSPSCPLVLTPSAAGATTGTPGSDHDDIVSDWIRRYLATAAPSGGGSGRDFADGIAFHGYERHAWPESVWYTTIPPRPTCNLGTICWAGPAYRVCPANTTCFGPIDTLIATIRSAANLAGATTLPLFDTEGSWGTPDLDLGQGGANDQNQTVPLDTAWMARWYLLQAAQYATTQSNLQAASWFDWDPDCDSYMNSPKNPGTCLAVGWGTLGYVHSGGDLWPFGVAGQTSHYGSGLAFGWLTKWLVGSTFVSPCAPEPSTGNNVWTCNLTLRNGDSAQIVWYPPSGSVSWPTGTYHLYQDLTGCEKQIPIATTNGGSILVSQQPLILLARDEGWGSNTCIP